MCEGEEPPRGPWARARMPDGQELEVIVTGRSRAADGRWWYACVVLMPGRRQTADGRAEPCTTPVPVQVAAEHVTPIPGERYDGLPTEGAVSGRQWVAVRARGTASGPPWWSVHRRDCWQAKGGWRSQRITEARAAALVREHGPERICDVCRPDWHLPSPRCVVDTHASDQEA